MTEVHAFTQRDVSPAIAHGAAFRHLVLSPTKGTSALSPLGPKSEGRAGHAGKGTRALSSTCAFESERCAACLLSLSPATSRVSPGTEKVQVSNRTISIFVNGVYGWPGAGLVPSCPVPCKITTDSKEILANWRTADIVIWNMQALVCGTMGAKWETKPLGQKWVANYDFETLPSGPAESLSPIVPGIDWTAHFQKDSDWAISCWTFFLGRWFVGSCTFLLCQLSVKWGGSPQNAFRNPK